MKEEVFGQGKLGHSVQSVSVAFHVDSVRKYFHNFGGDLLGNNCKLEKE